jgi:hypothetical protein
LPRLLGVDGKPKAAQRGLSVLVSVRCLECGSPYSKPAGGGTAATNPGCPECGYLGWVPVSAETESPQLRFSGGPRRRRFA